MKLRCLFVEDDVLFRLSEWRVFYSTVVTATATKDLTVPAVVWMLLLVRPSVSSSNRSRLVEPAVLLAVHSIGVIPNSFQPRDCFSSDLPGQSTCLVNMPQPMSYQVLSLTYAVYLVICMRLEVLVAVCVELNVIWDMTPCRFVHNCQRFGGFCCDHLQSSKSVRFYKALRLIAHCNTHTHTYILWSWLASVLLQTSWNTKFVKISVRELILFR